MSMSNEQAVRPHSAALIDLARLGRLPRHQYMDAKTLQWIEANDPRYGQDALTPRLRSDLPNIPVHWFAEEKEIQSIHGLRHHARVAVYAGHLAAWLALGEREQREAVLAAAIHDCRRQHDQHDPGHGARAATWFEDAAPEIMSAITPGAEVRNDVVATALELHDLPHSEFCAQQLQRYRRTPDVVDVVKTADALDRYRLPKLKWWPDDGRLQLKPPPWLHRFAWRLVVVTEKRDLGFPSAARSAALRDEGGMR
jgi:hypothetical protein